MTPPPVSILRLRHPFSVWQRPSGRRVSAANRGVRAHPLGLGFRSVPPGERSRNASALKKTCRISFGPVGPPLLSRRSRLFDRLDKRVLPGSQKAARPFLLTQLHKLTKERLTRYGNTIFHLEPNVKMRRGDCATIRPRCGCAKSVAKTRAAEQQRRGRRTRLRRGGFSQRHPLLSSLSQCRNDNTLRMSYRPQPQSVP